MGFMRDFFGNCVFIVPILSWMIAQIIKMLIHLFAERELSLERLWGGGGMPSCHSATVSALVAMTGWTCGFNSVFFAISAIFAAVVMHDAMGVRLETGKQASSIKQIAVHINSLISDKDEEVRTDALKELVGHTPLQVFFGFIIGILVAVVYCVACRLTYGCFSGGFVI